MISFMTIEWNLKVSVSDTDCTVLQYSNIVCFEMLRCRYSIVIVM